MHTLSDPSHRVTRQTYANTYDTYMPTNTKFERTIKSFRRTRVLQIEVAVPQNIATGEWEFRPIVIGEDFVLAPVTLRVGSVPRGFSSTSTGAGSLYLAGG